ncbi:parallel beta-helix domain-containing protein [Marinobacter mobilis]|uniref:parallel beta-helix domain-containing protein n=1 Tax=Marinobacter mobilis TaxID=488533 RepID=UPI0035C73FF8
MKQNLTSTGLAVALTTALLSGCSGGGSDAPAASDRDNNQAVAGDQTAKGPVDRFSDGRIFTINPGTGATNDMVAAMIQMRPGDVMSFGCGFFELDQGLLLQATENIRIEGCGKDETVLSFRNSVNVTGLEALNVRGITVEGLTILDSPGDAFKLKGVKWGTLRDVRAIWSGGGTPITADNYGERLHVACTAPPFNEGDPAVDYVPSSASGRYGIYPVESENILVENSESVGASDAGIYVGQTNTAIIRNSRAVYNVMGFEIENVQGGEYDNNVAECNTGGFLIYDLENITQYGDTSVMLNNIASNNNTYNFAHSGLVSAVPRGTGFITLGYDNIEIFNNVFEDHSTAAVIYTSYELIDGKDKTSDKKLDPYTEGLHIHNNIMRNSGYDLPPPDLEAVLDGQVETVLPTLIGIKNASNPGKGAHIVWDGLLDDLDADCGYPLDANGEPVPMDENGKPIHTNAHPNPACHYNAYKFNAMAERKLPQWGSCFHSNDLGAESQPYMNFHGTQGLELVLAAAEQDPSILSPEGIQSILEGASGAMADTDASVHDCQARFGQTLAALPRVVIPPYEPSGDIDPAPSEEYINRLCERNVSPGSVNRRALEVNCPRLDQYNLFADAQDPRSTPNEGGVPFVLNSKLFSDYSTKYRVAFIPPGTRAIYYDGQNGGNLNGALHFPNGTVIAKTFTFTDESQGTEELVETRLLIRRVGESGKPFWDGLTYIWETDASGNLVANLAMGGGTRAVSWHYQDSNSGRLLSGSTDHYAIPNANQCITCHSNDDVASGSAPIGPKPRNLNRPYSPESSFMGTQGQGGFPQLNQLQYWQDQGLITGMPTLTIDGRGIATNVERLPHWNVPGDGGEVAGSAADIEQRTRAYLEVNCQHCHNDRGAASNTGFYLDHFRPVNASYGICKKPTATGGGSCGRQHVIVPGDPDASIVSCRVGSDNDPQRMMPPIGRSLAHAEALELLDNWIANVVTEDYENGDACGGGTIFQSLAQ